jgi:hypothetical protein
VSAWNTGKAAELARTAYRYVAATHPKDESLESLDGPQDAVLEAQSAGDWQAYEEALRELCRAAKREAIKAERVKAGAA